MSECVYVCVVLGIGDIWITDIHIYTYTYICTHTHIYTHLHAPSAPVPVRHANISAMGARESTYSMRAFCLLGLPSAVSRDAHTCRI